MVKTRGKIIEKSNFTLQLLPFSSKKISVVFNFFEFLDAYFKKSTGMRKSQVGVVFHDFWLFLSLCVCWAPWCYLLVWLTHNFIFFRLPQPGEVDRLFWVTYYFRILLLFIIMNLLLTTKSIKLEMELLWHQRQSKHLKTYSNVITLI